MRKRNRRPAPKALPLVDIVIVTGGRWDMLEICLQSIKDTVTIPHNVIVIDNATPPAERVEHLDMFEGIQTKRLSDQAGYSYANNEGVRMGHAPLILLLNDDVQLLPGCVDKMVRRMDDPQYAVVGAKLLFPETSSSPIRPAGRVQHVGHAMNISAQIVHPLVGWRADHPKCCISREVFSVTGACFLTRRILWNKVGGLDIDYGAGTYEEVDYCLKVRQLGGKIYVDTDAVAYHYTGATSEKKNISYPMQINSMKFVTKWSSSGLFIWDEWTFY